MHFSARKIDFARLQKPRHPSYLGDVARKDLSRTRVRLSHRLQRILTDNPTVRSFSIHQIIASLDDETGSAPIALFSAASILEPRDADFAPGTVCGAYGLKIASRSNAIRIPRAILRRRIPRNTLSLLIHSLKAAVHACENVVRQRWNWVFHPVMQAALGTIIFLLALTSMAPIIGGGVQHAASTFVMAIGLAERDGLVVVLGALAGMAALAMAAMSVSSGRKVWNRIKDWLVWCARRLHLSIFAQLLDRCHQGLGDLVRLRWGDWFLVLLGGEEAAIVDGRRRAGTGRLKSRARRSHFAAMRAKA